MALEGKGDQIKGNIKEGLGEVTDNQSLENEGKADQLKAKAKQAGDDIKDAFSGDETK